MDFFKKLFNSNKTWFARILDILILIELFFANLPLGIVIVVMLLLTFASIQSIKAAKGVEFKAYSDKPSIRKNSKASVRFRAKGEMSPVLLTHSHTDLNIENLLTGENSSLMFNGYLFRKSGTVAQVNISDDRCGVIRISSKNGNLRDLYGKRSALATGDSIEVTVEPDLHKIDLPRFNTVKGEAGAGAENSMGVVLMNTEGTYTHRDNETGEESYYSANPAKKSSLIEEALSLSKTLIEEGYAHSFYWIDGTGERPALRKRVHNKVEDLEETTADLLRNGFESEESKHILTEIETQSLKDCILVTLDSNERGELFGEPGKVQVFRV